MSKRFITRKAFRAWLAAMPSRTKPCHEYHCPLEAATGFIVWGRYWQPDLRFDEYPLPSWAVAFVDAVDVAEPRVGDWRYLTAGRILKILDAVPS